MATNSLNRTQRVNVC